MPVNSFEDYPMSWRPQIDPQDKPIYLSLARQLKNDIMNGELNPGTKLPPQRELADYLDINLSTITRAFKICEEKGLICSVVGRGTFVSADAASNGLIDIIAPTQKYIEMGAILPSPDVDLIITGLLGEMSREPDFYKNLQYNPLPYAKLQIESAQKWLSYFHLNATSSNILYANGSQNAIFSILASVFRRGDKIATVKTTYPGLKVAAKILGIQLIPIPQYDGKITLQSLEYVRSNHNVQGFYFIPDYNNPTNEIMDTDTRTMIGLFAEQHKLPVMEDAIYTLFTPEPLPTIASFAPNFGILISSVSKVMSPGLRLAIMYVPEQYSEMIGQCLYAMQITPPSLSIQLFTRLMITDRFDLIRELRIEEISQRYQMLKEVFKNQEMDADRHSPICWLHLSGEYTADEFEKLALSKGVRVCSASRFMIGSEMTPNAIRISIISEHSLERFQEGLVLLNECQTKNKKIRGRT